MPQHVTHSPVQLPSWLKYPSGHWERHCPSISIWEGQQAVQLCGLCPAHPKQDWWQAGKTKQNRQSGKSPYDKCGCSVSPISIPGLKHNLHIHFHFPKTHLTYFFLKAMSWKTPSVALGLNKAQMPQSRNNYLQSHTFLSSQVPILKECQVKDRKS